MPDVDVSEGLSTVPSAAMGLSEVVRWTREHPFIDIFKTTVQWVGTSTSGTWNARSFDEMRADGILDENGWPTEIPSDLGTIATTLLSNLPEENVSMAGRYHLQYEGEGTVEIRGANGLIDIVSQEDGLIVFDFTPGDGHLLFEIEETDPNGTGDYVRNVTIVKEEYLDLHEAGAIFNPVWIDLIEDLGSVRFMDWMRTNDSLQSEWADRPQVGDTTYATGNGVPLEVMVELANQIGSDPWFNIPFHATEEYIREFAAYVRDNLDPDLKAKFEFSNEVWNSTFDQTDDANAAGRELWGTEFGDNPARHYYGYRSAEVMDIIKDEFGEEAGRVEGILGVHTATPTRFERIMIGAERYADENGANVDELFDSVAVTWYFGGGYNNTESYNQLKAWDAIGRDFMLDQVFEQLLNGGLLDVGYTTIADSTEKFPLWGDIAQQYGLDLISYEGGPHIVGSPANRNDEEFVEILTAINRDPRMLDVYNEVHSAWVEAGGGLFNAFQDIKRDGKSGSWGHLTHLDDEDARWDAMVAINATPNPNITGRDASDFDHGRTILGGDGDELLVGTLEEDFLIGAGGNDELHGGNKEDGLHGGAGDDELYAGAGDDNVIGGDGNDWLDGGSGVDNLQGGAGDDTIVYDAEDDFSNVDGGAGIDTLRVVGGEVPTLNLAAHGLERADHVVTDQGSADWSEYVDHYNSNWVRLSQDGTFDDGWTWHTEWDVADEFDWSEFTEIFDGAGNFVERIEVSDEDDPNQAPTDINVSGGDVNENAAGGTVVATLSAADPDVGDSFTFSITNDPSGFFEVVGNEVRVIDGADIDFETAQTHQIIVQVTDAGGLSYSEAVTVTVNDQDENAENNAPTDIVVGGGAVDENADGGTVVATLSAVDSDAGDSFTFSITNDPSGFFEVVGNQVRVTDGADIDFETAQSHQITVEVTDAGGLSYSEVVTVTVNDQTENGDPIDIVVDGGSVDENADGGAVVATLSAVDPDGGDSFTYAITNDPSGLFAVSGNQIKLVAGADVDFEAAQSHDVTVEVTDASGATYSEVITLSVNDLNDETPTDIVVGGGSVDEDASGGTVVATLSAVDADAGDSFTFAITNDPSGFFEVVGNQVRVADGANLDFDTAQSHQITVEVTDAAGHSYSEDVTVTVNEDTGGSPGEIAVSGGSVDEDARGSTVIARLSVTGSETGERFSYEIADDPSGLFTIIGSRVKLERRAELDFETAQSHDITIVATGSAGTVHTETITLSVNDLNDETPTDIIVDGGTMDENAPGGTVVATLSAVDADAGDSFSFEITNDPTGLCEMVGNEIRLVDGAEIDFEQTSSVDITVEVTDAAGNSYSEIITLTVNDVSDEAPTDIIVGGGEVEENSAAGTVVATLSAVDPDSSDGLTYAITNDPSGLFEIVGNEIRVAPGADIDFEAAQSHNVTVEVTDPDGNAHSEVISLDVSDLNDETPTDIVVGGGSVDEEAAAGSVVAVLSSVDADANDSFTYAITKDPSGLFEIVGNEVRVASGAVIDFEVAQTHDITVEVTDAGSNSYSEVITVTVNDLSEDPDVVTVRGTVGDDVLVGTALNELLFGDSGDDWLDGGEGIDTNKGGAGDDKIVFDEADNLAGLDGGTGFDTLIFEGVSVEEIDLLAHNLEAADVIRTDENNNRSWSQIVDHYDADWTLVGQDGTYDNGDTWNVVWDVDDSETWASQVTRVDVAGTDRWSTLTERFNDDGDLLQRVEVKDDGKVVTRSWDADGLEDWAREITFLDAVDEQDWTSRTSRYDDQGRRFEQINVEDDGRIIEQFWDYDGAESWFRQIHITDAEDAYDWSEQIYEFDESGNLFNHTVIDDAIA